MSHRSPPIADETLPRGLLYGLMALHVGCASATYLFGKAAAVGFDNPEVLTFLRAAGAAVIFLLLTGSFIPRPRFNLKEWGQLCWFGFLLVPFNQYCFIKGLQYTVPSHPALLYALTPLGSGTLTIPGMEPIAVMPQAFADGGHNWIIMILPPGAFLTLGVVVGVVEAAEAVAVMAETGGSPIRSRNALSRR